MTNVTFIDSESKRFKAVMLGVREDGGAELTYQAGGQIRTVVAEPKRGAGSDVYVARKEKDEG